MIIEIIRETEKEDEWLNRFCKDVYSGRVLYYCEVSTSEESKLVVHRGPKSGPIIAQINPCLATPGLTDIQLSDPLYTLELEHVDHPDYTSFTKFSYNGKNYHWKGHAELVEEDTGERIAQFYESWLVVDVKEHKLGKLVMNDDAKELMDLVVITAFAIQERSDEAKKAVDSVIPNYVNILD